jgi:hypothetical protein
MDKIFYLLTFNLCDFELEARGLVLKYETSFHHT